MIMLGLYFTIQLFCLVSVSNCLFFSAVDPDVNRNVSQLITSKGYPVEEYELQTEDGYILKLFRIPHGRNSRTKPNGKVVYLQHGIMGAASDWILNFENSSLALVLADAGYDVWLGNSRGNKYSRKHIIYSTKQKIFWNFSFNEMGIYDLPATIDFVLHATGQRQLNYISHSQGCTILFILLSEKPEYNRKIKIGITLAPVAYASHMKGALTLLAPFSKFSTDADKLLGSGEFLPSEGLINNLTVQLCSTKEKIICKNALFLIIGPDSIQLNVTRLPVYNSHIPAGTSVMDLDHFAQLILSGQFAKYDHGPVLNLFKYGKLSPPEYPIEKISAPIALLWGQSDWLADPTDVAILRNKLPNVVVDYQVDYPAWTHADFILGIDANKYLYPEIFTLLSKF